METKCLQIFGQRLRELREERGISQRELAEIIGISKGAVYYYESDGRAPDIVTLEKLCDYFGVSADYLLGRTNARTPKLKLKSVCEKVGLSDKSVLMLARLKKENNPRLRIINLLLEQADSDIEDNYELEGRYEGSVLNAVCRYAGRHNYSSINEWEAEELFRDTIGQDNEALCIYDSPSNPPGYIPAHLYNAAYQIILNQATEAIKDFYGFYDDLVMNELLLENELFDNALPGEEH